MHPQIRWETEVHYPAPLKRPLSEECRPPPRPTVLVAGGARSPPESNGEERQQVLRSRYYNSNNIQNLTSKSLAGNVAWLTAVGYPLEPNCQKRPAHILVAWLGTASLTLAAAATGLVVAAEANTAAARTLLE